MLLLEVGLVLRVILVIFLVLDVSVKKYDIGVVALKLLDHPRIIIKGNFLFSVNGQERIGHDDNEVERLDSDHLVDNGLGVFDVPVVGVVYSGGVQKANDHIFFRRSLGIAWYLSQERCSDSYSILVVITVLKILAQGVDVNRCAYVIVVDFVLGQLCSNDKLLKLSRLGLGVVSDFVLFCPS